MSSTVEGVWLRGRAVLLALALGLGLLIQGPGLGRVASVRAAGCATPYLHTAGARILDACNNPLVLRALNWYGFDSNDFVAGGLHYWSYKTIINRIKGLGYNALRIPFSNEMVERNPVVSALSSMCVGYSCVPVPGTTATPLSGAYLLAAASDGSANNADLYGLDALHILKTIVDYAGRQGLYVILDNHRSEAAWGPEENGLWYTSLSCAAGVVPYTCFTPQSWFNDWATLGSLFQGDPNVIGMDLRNEPHWVNPNVPGGAGRWQPAGCADFVQYAHWGPCSGANNAATDWAQAATQAGDELLSYNPHWLIAVEGGSTYFQQPGNPTGSFTQDGWGENLQGAATDPIPLSVANQLVYSAHDYRWYQTNDTTTNMYSQWTRNFGFVTEPGHPYTAPLWIGEFGSCTEQNNCDQDIATGREAGWWFSTFMAYMQNGDSVNNVPGGISWSYWPVNGAYSNSWNNGGGGWRTCYGQREDYGVLGGDWSTLSSPLLQSMLIPASPTPTATATAASTASPTAMATLTPTATMVTTATPTATTLASATATITPTLTGTPTAQPTSTVTPGPTPSLGPPTQWPSYSCAPYSTAPAPTPTTPPANTLIPVPPTVTPARTPVPVPPVGVPTRTPAATATPHPAPATATPRPQEPAPTLCPADRPRLPLDWHLPGGQVESGAMLTLKLHTASRARVAVALQVVTSRVVVTGRGKQRHKVMKTALAYQLKSQGAADTHGWFSSRVRVTYKPTKAVQARLSAAVQRGCAAATRGAHVTISPPPPLSVSMKPNVVASGAHITVQARTAPFARVTAQVRVQVSKAISSGRGKQRKRVMHITMLYQTTIHGAASAHGRFSGRLRITYKTARPVRALLTVTVETRQGSATSTAPLMIQPQRHRA